MLASTFTLCIDEKKKGPSAGQGESKADDGMESSNDDRTGSNASVVEADDIEDEEYNKKFLDSAAESVLGQTM